MHGSSFRGDGRTAILYLAAVLREILGTGQSAEGASRIVHPPK
jgi:hypothetical protein